MDKDTAYQVAADILVEHFDWVNKDYLLELFDNETRKTYSTSEFAIKVKTSKATVQRWLREGIINGKKNAVGKTRIPESEIKKILG